MVWLKQGAHSRVKTTMTRFLARAYSRSENVLVMPVIVTELELSDVQMQVLFADLVESANAAALDERPETFNRIGVNGTNNIFSDAVIVGCVRVTSLGQAVVAQGRRGCSRH